MTCKKCGHEVLNNEAFCSNCGAPMGEDSVDITYGEPFNVAQEIPQTFAATDKEAEWSAVVQKKTERYIPLFKKFGNGDMFSWNWAALFGVIWLLYRKAYIAALLIFLLGNLLSCLGVWGLALPIATALLGDFIYYKHVERVVENAKFVPDKKVYYAKKGGTSVVAAFIPLLISIFLCVIIFQALAGFISMFRPF